MKLLGKLETQLKLDETIIKTLDQMDYYDAGTAEHKKMLDDLERLMFLRNGKKTRINKEQLISAGVNLLGILLILKFEKVDIITTKALGFVTKGRV